VLVIELVRAVFLILFCIKLSLGVGCSPLVLTYMIINGIVMIIVICNSDIIAHFITQGVKAMETNKSKSTKKGATLPEKRFLVLAHEHSHGLDGEESTCRRHHASVNMVVTDYNICPNCSLSEIPKLMTESEALKEAEKQNNGVFK
jgi:hypothetical protein